MIAPIEWEKRNEWTGYILALEVDSGWTLADDDGSFSGHVDTIVFVVFVVVNVDVDLIGITTQSRHQSG